MRFGSDKEEEGEVTRPFFSTWPAPGPRPCSANELSFDSSRAQFKARLRKLFTDAA
jgi:hypothetical protein